MKKLTILLLAFLLSVPFVFGQNVKEDKEKTKEAKKELKTDRVALRKLEGSMVSNLAKENFIADFGDMKNVKWKRDGLFDQATFTKKDGKVYSAFYDFDSNLVGTTHDVTFAEIPAIGQKEIKKEYKDYKIGPAIFFDDNDANESDMLLYGVQFADEDNYFVELTKGTKKIILQILSSGEVFFFKEM